MDAEPLEHTNNPLCILFKFSPRKFSFMRRKIYGCFQCDNFMRERLVCQMSCQFCCRGNNLGQSFNACALEIVSSVIFCIYRKLLICNIISSLVTDFPDALLCCHMTGCHGYSASEVAMSLCGGLAESGGEISTERFLQFLVTYDDFCEKPSILNDPNLVVRINGKYVSLGPVSRSVLRLSSGLIKFIVRLDNFNIDIY